MTFCDYRCMPRRSGHHLIQHRAAEAQFVSLGRINGGTLAIPVMLCTGLNWGRQKVKAFLFTTVSARIKLNSRYRTIRKVGTSTIALLTSLFRSWKDGTCDKTEVVTYDFECRESMRRTAFHG